MQYKVGTVNVEKDSTFVSGIDTVFQGNVKVGDSFKVAGVNTIYQISAVDTTEQILHIAPAYQGATASGVRYQIMRDRTPLLNLAEINAGDEDWPYWLTNEVIRKLDVSMAPPSLAKLSDVYVGPTAPSDPNIRFWIDTSGN